VRILDRTDLKAKGIPYSNGYLLILEKRKQFPERLRLGLKRVGWIEDEVKDWIASRAEMRGEGFQSIGAVAAKIVEDINK